ncbi:hypothetical protein ACFL3B_03705 [Gemmatimonadota bacterium]
MRILTAALTLALFLPNNLSAQLLPGQRVRISSPEFGLEEQVGFVHRDSILVNRGGRGVRLAIPLTSVTRLEVDRGMRSRIGSGAALGLFSGVALGVIGGVTCSGWLCGGEMALIAAGVFAVPGLAIGTLIGASSTTGPWEEVPLDQLRVSFAPQRDGSLAVGVTLRF